MCAYAQIDPRSAREQQITKNVNVILSRERKPMTVSQICRSMTGVDTQELQAVVYRYPDNFECFQDVQLFIKLITKVSICETHCSKNKTCPGTIPFCSGLHVCKFYILSGKCRFGGQCTFGHDLTISHNMQILKEHFLDGVAVEDLRFLLGQTESRTSITVPRICKFYNVGAGCRNSESGRPCPNLHICRHYVIDTCRYGRNCRRSHNVMDHDVKSILKKHGINTRRTPKEILADLMDGMSSNRSDDGSVGSAPMLGNMAGLQMSHGNYGNQSSSDDSDDCNSFQFRNRKGLPIPPQRQRTNPGQVQTGLPKPCRASSQRGPRQALGQHSTGGRVYRDSSTDKNSLHVICFFHLRGQCAFGESCRNFHGDLPYQWMFRHCGVEEWNVLPDQVNLDMELTYSDPDNQEYYMDIGQNVKVQFKMMTGSDVSGQNYDVHRMSTSSSVEFERQPLTTLWVWYWKDQIGEWKQYGDNNCTGYKSNISSSDLEQAYIANPEGQLAFNTLGHEYILDFPKMVQHNLQYKTEREVCRRPAFVSKQAAEDKKKQLPSGHGSGAMKGASGGVGTVTAPPHWNMATGADIMDHCQLVELVKKLPSTQKEYKEIEALFCGGMPSTVSIKSIERIENGDLWDYYISKKARMLKKNNSKNVGERRLFHGTQSRYVDAICRQGFDFRLNGQTVGTMYGKGSYFATTSKYSDCYTDQSSIKAMFIVKVLVGEYVQGKGNYVRPPSKDESNPCSELYDSCVDDKNNPKIFVIFDNNGQIYPEYVIKYEYKYDL